MKNVERMFLVFILVFFCGILWHLTKEARQARKEFCDKFLQENVLLIEECVQQDGHSKLYCERLINPERFCH